MPMDGQVVVVLTEQERASAGAMAEMIRAAQFFCEPGKDAREQEAQLQAAAIRLFIAGPLADPAMYDEKIRHGIPFFRAAYWYGRAFATDPNDPAPLFEKLKQEAYAQMRLDDLIRPDEQN